MLPADSSAATLLKLSGEATPSWATFDPSWYVSAYPTICDSFGPTSPTGLLSFYLQVGQGLGHSPNRYFDETWYRMAYPDVFRDVQDAKYFSGFDHYCRIGHQTLAPHWLFSEQYYRDQNPDLTDEALDAANVVNGYDHFLRWGAQEWRRAHPFFDPDFYQAELAADAARVGIHTGPFHHFLDRIESGRYELRTSQYLHPAWYLLQYPEIASAIERGGWRCALHHYLANGTPTRFDPLPEFSEALYLRRYPDVAAAVQYGDYRNGYDHFIRTGLAEGRLAEAASKPAHIDFESSTGNRAPGAIEQFSLASEQRQARAEAPVEPLANAVPLAERNANELTYRRDVKTSSDNKVLPSSIDHSSNGIVVLGMHRSGTSLLAQLLYQWGASIDTAGMVESNTIFNPKGYWEPAPLVRFNDQLLSILQSRWSVPPRDDAKMAMAAMAGQDRLRQRAVDLLTAAYAGGKPWFWKDPRLAILLPFWKHFLGDVLYFVSLREPGDIARSLSSRDDISIPDSLLLWQKYMLDILADDDVQSTGIFLIYENLLADPPGECARLCRLLDQRFGVSAPHPDDRLERMVATVDAALWRNRSQAAFTEHPFATAVQKQLYSALIERAAETGHIAPQDFPLPADWRVELSSSDSWRGMGLTTSQCQVYWRAARSGYSEADSDSVRVSMEGQPQFLKIPIPGSGDGAAAIRVDLTDRPALVWVTQMELQDSAENVIWEWDRCADSMARLPQNEIASCTSLPGESGCRLELPGYDPWIEIVLDQSQTAATREGASIILQCTYSASLAYAQFVHVGRIREVLSRLDDVVAWLQKFDDRQTDAQAAAENRTG